MAFMNKGNKHLLYYGPEDPTSASQADELAARGWQVRLNRTPQELLGQVEAAHPVSLALLRLAAQDGRDDIDAMLSYLHRNPAPLIILADEIDPDSAQRLSRRPHTSFLSPRASGPLLGAAAESALEAFADHRGPGPFSPGDPALAREAHPAEMAEIEDLYQNAPVGFFSLDTHGRVGQVNQTELDWLGYTREEMLGRPILDFVAPDSRDLSRQYFSQLTQRGRLRDEEIELLRKDGTPLPVLLNATAIYDEPGGLVMIRAAVADIFRLKQAQQALQQSEARYRLLFENMQEGFSLFEMVYDESGRGVDFRLLEANAAYERYTGLSPDQVVGRAVLDLFPDISREQMAGLVRAAQSGEPLVFEMYLSAVQRHLRAHAFRPQPDRYATIVEDITERKLAEQALQQSEAVLKSFFDAVQQDLGILRVRPEIQDLEFLRMNREAMKNMKIPPQAVPGALASQYGMSLGNRRLWLEGCQLSQESGKPAHFEFMGEIRIGLWLLASLQCIEPGVFSYSVVDITDLKRMQSELSQLNGVLEQRVALRTVELSQANLDLKQALRLREEFLNHISHELRTPLNTILGSAEVLQTRVFGELNPRQLQVLANIETGGQQLLRQVDNLLEMSQFLAGKIALQPTFVPVDAILQDCLHWVEPEADRKNLQVELVNDGRLEYLLADKMRLEQILFTLLENAVKFTQAGGKIGLEFRADQAGKVVHWTVWDTGIGMTREQQALLFGLFVQGDGSLSRHHGGLGMGLAMVNELIKLHAGSIHVGSAPGEGSRFTVTLPWLDPAL
jgi:PAS domain S-box-containing protein